MGTTSRTRTLWWSGAALALLGPASPVSGQVSLELAAGTSWSTLAGAHADRELASRRAFSPAAMVRIDLGGGWAVRTGVSRMQNGLVTLRPDVGVNTREMVTRLEAVGVPIEIDRAVWHRGRIGIHLFGGPVLAMGTACTQDVTSFGRGGFFTFRRPCDELLDPVVGNGLTVHARLGLGIERTSAPWGTTLRILGENSLNSLYSGPLGEDLRGRRLVVEFGLTFALGG